MKKIYSNNADKIKYTNQVGALVNTYKNFCNDKKNQGLFFSKIEELDNQTHLILSSIDESLEQYGCIFDLAQHHYSGTLYPQGSKYICRTTSYPIPSTTYCIGPIKLSKQILLCENESRLLIRYNIEECNVDSILRINPLFGFREIHSLAKANRVLRNYVKNLGNGIAFSAYNFYPTVYVQFSNQVDFISKPDWYYNFEYKAMNNSGNEHEDLYSIGNFEMMVREGSSIFISVGFTPIENKKLKHLFQLQKKNHIQQHKKEHLLVASKVKPNM